jgi:hypothetical protein
VTATRAASTTESTMARRKALSLTE